MQKYGVIIGVIKMREKGMSFPDCERRHFISSWTAQEIMKKYARCGQSREELEQMNASEVEELFYPQEIRRHRKIPMPDFSDLFERLQTSGKKISKTEIWDLYTRPPDSSCDGRVKRGRDFGGPVKRQIEKTPEKSGVKQNNVSYKVASLSHPRLFDPTPTGCGGMLE